MVFLRVLSNHFCAEGAFTRAFKPHASGQAVDPPRRRTRKSSAGLHHVSNNSTNAAHVQIQTAPWQLTLLLLFLRGGGNIKHNVWPRMLTKCRGNVLLPNLEIPDESERVS